MANPPIVIGPFDNVPAPGSPIRSNWPQEITQYAVDTNTALVNVLNNVSLLLGEQKVFAATVSVHTDASGIVGVAFPAGTFETGTGVAVLADNPDVTGGNPAAWRDVKAYAATAASFNVQIVTRGTNTPVANADVLVTYIAIGIRP